MKIKAQTDWSILFPKNENFNYQKVAQFYKPNHKKMGHKTIISKLIKQLLKLDLQLDSYSIENTNMGCRRIVLRLKDQRMPPVKFEYWSGILKHKLVILNIMQEISMTAKATSKKQMESGANRDVVDYYDNISNKIDTIYKLNTN